MRCISKLAMLTSDSKTSKAAKVTKIDSRENFGAFNFEKGKYRTESWDLEEALEKLHGGKIVLVKEMMKKKKKYISFWLWFSNFQFFCCVIQESFLGCVESRILSRLIHKINVFNFIFSFAKFLIHSWENIFRSRWQSLNTT